MKQVTWALFGLAMFWASPAFAEQECDECPRVQLQRVEDQVRIAAEDDRDAYEDLKFRVRFVTANGASEWTDWADTNAYGLRTTIGGRIEAESIDLEGHVGRGVIHITAPDIDTEPGTRGPGTVEEDSNTEARWDSEATADGGATAEELAEEIEETTAAQWLDAQDYDHSVCPVSSTDSDAACTSAPGGAPEGALAGLIAMLGLLVGRRR